MRQRSVRLTDAQWAAIEPHLPRHPRSRLGGRPRVPHRDVVDGILWVLKTGARWRDLPAGRRPGESDGEFPGGEAEQPDLSLIHI